MVSPAPASRRPTSSSITDGGSFTPGEVLADRYRIIALLGRGGMGEVYRADDLKLGQPVALKFLPAAMARDESFTSRFRAEVRNARQVSHPNVCRVYDLGEIGGWPFLSMEYVDGEDLASLLKRIGRLPPAKALEIAHQLCAGLAAAHDKGLIHRDLKPSNIMIDGQGRARITDFGLAVHPEEAGTEGKIIGTPAYMSPEQLASRPATLKSDLYALGLVLYEMFTGKRAFEAATIAEWRHKHEEEEPSAPSSHVTDLDPAAERMILRCLQKDPKLRPASALQVAAGLPGGDPLAAALAAGETPSPEMVAAAGETEGLKPRTAVALLCVILIFIPAICWLVGKTQVSSIVPLGDAPGVLAARARQLTRLFGYNASPADSAYGYDFDLDYLRYIDVHEKSPNRWQQLKFGNPSAMTFWYRQSPRYLEPQNFFSGLAGSVVSQEDPPKNISGMTYTVLDPAGRLVHFEAVPPQREPANGPSPAPDWEQLFTAAGLDMTELKTAEPEWTPPRWSDERTAWTGTAPGRPDVPLRVEAAAFRGKPVYFQLVWPWTRAEQMQEPQQTAQTKTLHAMELVLFLAVLIGAVLLARRNLRMARGDRRGAFRLALFVLLMLILSWAITAHHLPTSYELGLFVMGASWALFVATVAWLLYIGLEPYVRRRWPNAIISWSRMLAGQFRDPLVGRDILIGMALGLGVTLLRALDFFVEGWTGKLPPRPSVPDLASMLGVRGSAGLIFTGFAISLGTALALFFLFFLLRLLLRKELLAGTVFVLIFAALALPGKHPLVDAVSLAMGYVALLVVLKRFGFTPLPVALLANYISTGLVQTPHLAAWYASSMILGIIFFLGLAIYGFRISLAGQPIFSSNVLDD